MTTQNFGIMDFSLEKKLSKEYAFKDNCFFVGLDEVGRGAWAGPLCVGFVTLPFYVGERPNMQEIEVFLAGINDSKAMSAQRREHYELLIKKSALAYSFGIAYADTIDKYGISQATDIAIDLGLRQLYWSLEQKGYMNPHFVCVADEGLRKPDLDMVWHWQTYIKGDSKHLSIAAASILAKCERDRFMQDESKLYFNWELDKNKGYASKKHIEMANTYGLSSIHRRTFKVKGFNK